ncbi:MAG: hypothetical protein M1826_006678 [Phylliscum demangeonii]|nr:MAG: hypothetical protein M1826_006678 [Phylliscum demangeonii]
MPLAIFAVCTTAIACLALSIQAMLVYSELAFVLIHDFLLGPKPPTSLTARRAKGGHRPMMIRRRYSLRTARYHTITLVPDPLGAVLDARTDDAAAADSIGDRGLVRDFEGVGGWRFTGPGEEDAQWMACLVQHQQRSLAAGEKVWIRAGHRVASGHQVRNADGVDL